MEFVNDHNQARWWIDHIADIGSMDSGGQLFTACQFGFQRTQRAYGMRQIQIAYAAHGMRQPLDDAERRTSLEIQEHEMQPVGRIAHRHGQAPALQQHGFAGARGAGDQGVRPLAGQIDRERPLPRPHAHGDAQRRGGEPCSRDDAPWQRLGLKPRQLLQ